MPRLTPPVSAVLGWKSAHTPDLRRGFFDLGMDSLMALDLKNRLQESLGLPLRATVVFNYSTIDALSDFLTDHFAPSDVKPSVAEQSVDATPAANIDSLSDEDTMRLLDQQLAALGPETTGGVDHE